MNRHPLDVFSLGAGSAFIAIALAFLVGPGVNGALIFPLLLVLLGGLGVFAAVKAQWANDDAVTAASPGIDGDALQG